MLGQHNIISDNLYIRLAMLLLIRMPHYLGINNNDDV
jgi:hypothetical protein